MDAMMRAGLATDARSLEALKNQARQAPAEATRQAARQFEAMFIGMLLKSMREALPEGDPLSSGAGRMYTGMLDSEIAQKMASRGIGLADAMVRQIERRAVPAAQPSPATAAPAPALPAASSATPRAAAGPAQARMQTDFIERMQAPARAAAKEIGIPAHFVLGQAALESGWGRREIRGADGAGSHNLFGIKAGAGWRGPTVETWTTEYVNGSPRKVVERFRAYGSYGEAFRDYARLIGGNPRYAEAARAGGDADAFARRIQNAGYATDPGYAGKLAQVIERARRIITAA